MPPCIPSSLLLLWLEGVVLLQFSFSLGVDALLRSSWVRGTSLGRNRDCAKLGRVPRWDEVLLPVGSNFPLFALSAEAME